MQREELSEALKRMFDMDEEDAVEVTHQVVAAFDGSEELPDDRLDPELRSLFYTLEAKKLLGFRREDGNVETGERRRTFYWRVRTDVIRRAAEHVAAQVEQDVYGALPANVWARRAN